jgi:DNA-binding CsgD family transcriptional regulator
VCCNFRQVRTRAGVLVGREVELATVLTRLCDSAAGEGSPACFCLGEPGAGKTRLVAEVARRMADDGWVVVRGRTSSTGSVSPLRPFAEALASIQRRGLLPDDQLGGYRPHLARVLPQLPRPEDGGTEGAAPLVVFAEAVLRVLTAIGNGAGCLLVLEDLHDADSDSLAVLEYLLDNLGHARFAILGALRDEPGNVRDLLTAAEQRGATELVPIRPLDQAHTGLLVASCLGTDQPPTHLTTLVWRHSAGNPLVVEELLYDMIDSGQLCRHGTDWYLSGDPVLTPPPSMLQLVGSRMSRLDDVARQLLVTAAVYGERFPAATVESAVGASKSRFSDAIRTGLAHQLIVAEAPGWYRFHHPLTHGAILELAAPDDARQAAARLADAVLAEDPQRSAATCRQGARLLAEAGKSVVAAELYARAGREALRTSAVEWAVADLSEAIRLTPSRQRPALDLVGDLVDALIQACQWDRALELVDRLGPAVDGPSCRARARMHLDLARGCHHIGRVEQATVQLARARALATSAADELLRIHCDAIAAQLTLDPTGAANPVGERLAQAAAEAAELFARTAAEAATRRAAAEVACRAWNALSLILRVQDRYEEFCACRQRIHHLVEEYQLPGWTLVLRNAEVFDRLMIEGDDLPMQLMRDDAQRLGAVDYVVHLDQTLLAHQVMASEGSMLPVMAELTRHAEHSRRTGDLAGWDYALGALLMAAALRADRRAHTGLLDRCRPASGAPSTSLQADMDFTQAICLVMQARDGEALAKLHEVVRRYGIGEYYNSCPLGFLLLLATMAGTASPEQVADALRTSSRMRWTRQLLHWAAAVHAGRLGETDRAAWHAEQAAQAAAIYPATRHLAARLVAPAAAADGWGTPIEDLRAAEAWFHEQGVPAAARSCRDVLRTLGAPVPQRRAGTETVPAGLRAAGVTAREYEVGLLLGEHLGNRDIGERLHISPRTVEKHIAALLSKLTAPDRRTLIDRIAEAS